MFCMFATAARMNTSMDLRHAFLSLSAVITCQLMLCKMSEKSFFFLRESAWMILYLLIK